MKIKLYQVDAFANKVFEGNPAAVCPLENWLDDHLLKKIAEENNLSETAFFVQTNKNIQLRWFTPLEEVDLCGHATLAAAYVLYQHCHYSAPRAIFDTKSGQLVVTKIDTGFSMDFPASMPQAVDSPAALLLGLGKIKAQTILAGFDYVVVLDSVKEVMDLSPDFSQWLNLDLRGVVVTAQGTDVDFVSRCFFPKLSVNEDPVTGSAHCELAPYWGRRLGLTVLCGRQLSKRSGVVHCRLVEDRVILTGNGVEYMTGEINI
ncbi:PhzF family phenazine biosynthesis protein [Paraglaciecola sp. MB-3u-78]|jgi:PhzF family phenazine biosynthesis protein|uniref:PhzF family phenazine biosynthesis protein n=1 Tax=Paraglaciecola sp. MB-3u-78 TaxID=2058332 RepID=UPI000C32F124|nr:PhzF family phenazine biosynthesis protein [Paraglaciecola sp. MB-3u-78]PKG99035.1 isomerase [Paraglaciecola sp. MB-3u-78]